MNPNPAEVIRAFEARHGGPEAAVISKGGNWILYPDGARRDMNPLGLLLDPPGPNDVEMHPYRGSMDRLELEILTRRIQYWEAKVYRLVRAHNQMRDSMMGNDYSDTQLKELEQIADNVKAAREELDDLKAERAENPVAKAREARNTAESERQQRIEQKAAVLKQMKV